MPVEFSFINLKSTASLHMEKKQSYLGQLNTISLQNPAFCFFKTDTDLLKLMCIRQLINHPWPSKTYHHSILYTSAMCVYRCI